MSATVLFVDDDRDILASLRRRFRNEPYEILTAPDAAEATSILARQKIDVVVCDYQMPGISGLQFLTMIKDKYPSTTRIMLTGWRESRLVIEAVNTSRVSRFFTKPFNSIELGAAIREGLLLENEPWLYLDEQASSIDQELAIRELDSYLSEISVVSRDENGRIELEDSEATLEEILLEAQNYLEQVIKR